MRQLHGSPHSWRTMGRAKTVNISRPHHSYDRRLLRDNGHHGINSFLALRYAQISFLAVIGAISLFHYYTFQTRITARHRQKRRRWATKKRRRRSISSIDIDWRLIDDVAS